MSDEKKLVRGSVYRLFADVNKYEDTLIDHLYNYYCKIKDRVFNNDFV